MLPPMKFFLGWAGQKYRSLDILVFESDSYHDTQKYLEGNTVGHTVIQIRKLKRKYLENKSLRSISLIDMKYF